MQLSSKKAANEPLKISTVFQHGHSHVHPVKIRMYLHHAALMNVDEDMELHLYFRMRISGLKFSIDNKIVVSDTSLLSLFALIQTMLKIVGIVLNWMPITCRLWVGIQAEPLFAYSV